MYKFLCKIAQKSGDRLLIYYFYNSIYFLCKDLSYLN